MIEVSKDRFYFKAGMSEEGTTEASLQQAIPTSEERVYLSKLGEC